MQKDFQIQSAWNDLESIFNVLTVFIRKKFNKGHLVFDIQLFMLPVEEISFKDWI